MSELKQYYESCRKAMQEERNEARRMVTLYDDVLDRNPDDDYARMMRNREYGKAKGLTYALLILADKMHEIEEQEGR